MPPELILDPAKIDTGRVLADRAALRQANPQRFEMEQVDAVVLLDLANHLIAGYKDVRDDEFWVRGHMPGFPLLPGVLMCEAAAQLTGFYAKKNDLVPGAFIVFAGLNDVRFRGQVKIGDRLWLVGKAEKINRRQITFHV